MNVLRNVYQIFLVNYLVFPFTNIKDMVMKTLRYLRIYALYSNCK